MSKNFKILFFYPNEPLVGMPPSHFALLSAYLKQDGFNDIRLFDCSMYKSIEQSTPQDLLRVKLGQVKKTNWMDYVTLKDGNIYDDFVKMVDEYKPDLIGVSLVDSTLKFALSFLEKIKDRNIPILTGGVGSTFLYNRILETGLVDYVCIGEGEETIVELCNRLYKREDCSDIRNIAYRDKNGQVVRNPLRPVVNLDEAPVPDFSIYDDTRFFRPFMGDVVRTLQVDTDRGCPYACTYCAAPKLRSSFRSEGCGNYYRVKSWDKAFSDMKALIEKHKLTFVWFTSETFFALTDEKFTVFAERYKKEVNLPFYIQSRLDTLSDTKVRLLSEIGCKNIGVGLEHGSEAIRDKLLNRRMSNETILDSVRLLAKYNLFCTFNNIIGLPDETRENVFETVELNRQISEILKGKHGTNVYTFMPFSGTKLTELCINKGYVKEGEVCASSFFKESILNMPSLSKEDIKGLERTLILYIMLPKRYYPDIKIAEKDDETFSKLVKIKNELYV